MKYDFTSIMDRHGKDAIAVDGLGPTLTHFAAGRKQPARFPGYRAEKSRIFTVIARKKPVGIRRPAFIGIDFPDQPSIS